MKLESAAILINKEKEWAKTIKQKIIKIFKKNKIKILSPKKSQIIITIGGDGTLLYYKNFYLKPYLAIGTKKSWLCQATNKNYLDYIKKLIKYGFGIEKRIMIGAYINKKRIPDCLNELTIRNKEHRIVEFRIKIKNKTYRFLADGVIFSSPTGSSAYAYSCGGKEMKKTQEKYQIVAIAPYRRKFKQMIVDKKYKSKLYIRTTCKTDAVIDGQKEITLKDRTKIIVFVSEKRFEFVKKLK
jgi:NAD+ kinase